MVTQIISPGYYDAESLLNAPQTAFSDITITYDATALQYTLSDAASIIIGASSTILESLGFEANVEYSGSVITSPNTINLAGARYIDVHASLQTTNVYDTHITSDVLARVPVEVGFGELQTWTSSLSYSTIKDVALSHICCLTSASGWLMIVVTRLSSLVNWLGAFHCMSW